MDQVLGIVYWIIVGHLIKKAGFTRKPARTGAVTLMMCLDARMPRSAWMREIGPALRHSRRQVAQAGKMPPLARDLDQRAADRDTGTRPRKGLKEARRRRNRTESIL